VSRLLSAPRLFGAACLVPPAAVATALFTQYRLDMQPCPWCVLQRAIFLAIALTALVGLGLALLRLRLPQRLAAGLMLVLAGCGVAAALWQHFVAAASASCKQSSADIVMQALGLPDLLPPVFAAYASCADAAATLLGVPYEFYSLALFIALGIAALLVLRRPA
jgi:disulfide bond formation protein DsbB